MWPFKNTNTKLTPNGSDMSNKNQDNIIDQAQMLRIRDDMLDSLDEELEMEIDEHADNDGRDRLLIKSDRLQYFKNLLHLQGELVKLQD